MEVHKAVEILLLRPSLTIALNGSKYAWCDCVSCLERLSSSQLSILSTLVATASITDLESFLDDAVRLSPSALGAWELIKLRQRLGPGLQLSAKLEVETLVANGAFVLWQVFMRSAQHAAFRLPV